MTDAPTPTQVVEPNTQQELPLSNVIDEPLKACIEAQNMAAKASWDFIKTFDINNDSTIDYKKLLNNPAQFPKEAQ